MQHTIIVGEASNVPDSTDHWAKEGPLQREKVAEKVKSKVRKNRRTVRISRLGCVSDSDRGSAPQKGIKRASK